MVEFHGLLRIAQYVSKIDAFDLHDLAFYRYYRDAMDYRELRLWNKLPVSKMFLPVLLIVSN